MRSTWLFGLALAGCMAHQTTFPPRAPMMKDTDLASVIVACHEESTPKEPHHVSCAPERWESSIYWDGADNIFFRPLVDTMGVKVGAEAINVNSLDEVPDSAWFQNRIGLGSFTVEDLRRGACTEKQRLDPEHAAPGSWVIDKGKEGGWTPGFRIVVPGKGKYLIKTERADDEPERQSAASVIGAAVLHAAGYYTTCEQIVWTPTWIFELTPGLEMANNFASSIPLDQKVLDDMMRASPRRNGRARFGASAWLSGYTLGPFRFTGTRSDDPNDVIAHEDRRDLRGMRVLSAWLGRVDAREANSLDVWVADDPKVPDSSPGHVVHHQMDTSEILGAKWAWDSVNRRLGRAYVVDYQESVIDLLTLGIRTNGWDRLPEGGHPVFGYYDLETFVPDRWKAEYPNAAFSRMTERDGAWMARILARFTPEMVRALAEMGDFTDPANTAYLTRILQGRLDRILERYLTRLSPIASPRIEGDRLCALDLAELRGLRPAETFRYRARAGEAELAVTKRKTAELCVTLPHATYLRIVLEDGVAKGPLVVHVRDASLTGGEGFQLLGIERPDP